MFEPLCGKGGAVASYNLTGALVASALLSDRYIADRFLPDKAIDLVDEAAAKLRIDATSRPQLLDQVSRRLLQVQMEEISLKQDAQSDSRAASRLADLGQHASDRPLFVRRQMPAPA